MMLIQNLPRVQNHFSISVPHPNPYNYSEDMTNISPILQGTKVRPEARMYQSQD